MARVDIKAILGNPTMRRVIITRCIIATQAREGITTTLEQAEVAYDRIQGGKTMHGLHYIVRMNKAVHATDDYYVSVCGTKGRATRMTTDDRRVTCKRCKRALEAQKEGQK
jgi:hypothetical protein